MNSFKAARTAAGLTQDELARRAGKSRITVNRIERKGVCTPRQAEIFAPLLNVSAAALTGRADPKVRDRSPLNAIRELPVAGEVAAGVWLEPDIADEPRFEPVPAVLASTVPDQHLFALVVRGPSINRTAADGAILVCASIDSGIDIADGDLVIVERIRHQGAMIETTAKFLRRTRRGFELWPNSTDPRYQTPILIADDDKSEEVRVAIKAKVLSVNSRPRNPWDPAPLPAADP